MHATVAGWVWKLRTHEKFISICIEKKMVCYCTCGPLRLPAAPALRDERRLLADALHRLLVALPVDGGDGGRALQLQVAGAAEVLVADLQTRVILGW